MMKELILKEDIINELQTIGVNEGQTIMVHTSLGSMGYICGGAQTVIEALIACVGENGTIMMPAQSWKNLDPSSGVHWEVAEECWDKIRENWPAYDKDITPTNTMGTVAEMFRKWPGTKRSAHPARSVCAYGKYADHLTADHDFSDIFGDSSPVGKLYELDGHVLLLGVGYDKNTSLHLADVRARYPSRRYVDESSAVQTPSGRQWITYKTLYVDGEDFTQIGDKFEEQDCVSHGQIGNAPVRFMKQRDLVDFAVNWIEKNRK